MADIDFSKRTVITSIDNDDYLAVLPGEARTASDEAANPPNAIGVLDFISQIRGALTSALNPLVAQTTLNDYVLTTALNTRLAAYTNTTGMTTAIDNAIAVLRNSVNSTTSGITSNLNALTTRVATLESNPSGNYKGAWVSGTRYEPGDIVRRTHSPVEGNFDVRSLFALVDVTNTEARGISDTAPEDAPQYWANITLDARRFNPVITTYSATREYAGGELVEDTASHLWFTRGITPAGTNPGESEVWHKLDVQPRNWTADLHLEPGEIITYNGNYYLVKSAGQSSLNPEQIRAVFAPIENPGIMVQSDIDAGTSNVPHLVTPRLIADNIASGLSEVESNDSLQGDGTINFPLRVANEFTQNDEDKLDGIETGAEVNPPSMTQAEIDAGTVTQGRLISPNLFAANRGTGGGGGGGLATVSSDATLTGNGTSGDPLSVANEFTDADEAKLDGIAEGATANPDAINFVTTDDTLAGTGTPGNPLSVVGGGGGGSPETGTFVFRGAWADLAETTLTQGSVVTHDNRNWYAKADIANPTLIEPGVAEDSDTHWARLEGEADFDNVLKTKLDGIETAATADQSDAEIKEAYENNADTNAFTDAERTKLQGIENGAQVNVGVEYTQAEKTKLDGVAQNAIAAVISDSTLNGNGTNGNILTVANPFTADDESKLDGIQAGAQVNVGVEYTQAEKTKLASVEADADVNPPLMTQPELQAGSLTDGRLISPKFMSDNTVGNSVALSMERTQLFSGDISITSSGQLSSRTLTGSIDDYQFLEINVINDPTTDSVQRTLFVSVDSIKDAATSTASALSTTNQAVGVGQLLIAFDSDGGLLVDRWLDSNQRLSIYGINFTGSSAPMVHEALITNESSVSHSGTGLVDVGDLGTLNESDVLEISIGTGNHGSIHMFTVPAKRFMELPSTTAGNIGTGSNTKPVLVQPRTISGEAYIARTADNHLLVQITGSTPRGVNVYSIGPSGGSSTDIVELITASPSNFSQNDQLASIGSLDALTGYDMAIIEMATALQTATIAGTGHLIIPVEDLNSLSASSVGQDPITGTGRRVFMDSGSGDMYFGRDANDNLLAATSFDGNFPPQFVRVSGFKFQGAPDNTLNVITDDSLTGTGTASSPLSVASSGGGGGGGGGGSGSGLASVATDSTITGDGTTDSPLSVANEFTDADELKLDGIEAGADVNRTNAELKTDYESNADTNAFTDAEKTKLADIATAATSNPNALDSVSVDATLSGIGTSASPLSVANPFTAQDEAKLDGIEAGADVNPTAAEIASAYEGIANVNRFTDADHTKLDGIEAGAQQNVGVEYTQTEKTKLAGVSTGANVGITSVASDATLTGNGTSGNTLKVANPFTEADETKLDGIATGAEVNPAPMTQAEIDAGTSTAERVITPQLLAANLGSGGGGGLSSVATDNTISGDGTASSPLSVADMSVIKYNRVGFDSATQSTSLNTWFDQFSRYESIEVGLVDSAARRFEDGRTLVFPMDAVLSGISGFDIRTSSSARGMPAEINGIPSTITYLKLNAPRGLAEEYTFVDQLVIPISQTTDTFSFSGVDNFNNLIFFVWRWDLQYTAAKTTVPVSSFGSSSGVTLNIPPGIGGFPAGSVTRATGTNNFTFTTSSAVTGGTMIVLVYARNS